MSFEDFFFFCYGLWLLVYLVNLLSFKRHLIHTYPHIRTFVLLMIFGNQGGWFFYFSYITGFARSIEALLHTWSFIWQGLHHHRQGKLFKVASFGLHLNLLWFSTLLFLKKKSDVNAMMTSIVVWFNNLMLKIY